MRWWIGLLCGALLVLAGCKDVDCTSEPEPGAEVRITEEGPGPHVDPISLRYSIDGGTFTEIADTSVDCVNRTFCQLGFEMPGSYEIQVRRGPATVTTFVEVSADFCHVQTESVAVSIPDA